MKIKDLLLIFLSLSFSVSLVLFSAFQVGRSQVQAETGIVGEEIEATSGGEAVVNQSSTAENNKVDYYLPYPGILPDHPLYWLKMFRDRLMLLLTQDPQVKLEKLMVYADKRLGAAKVLIEGGKVQLGITTATKGEKYLEQVVSQWQILKKANKTTLETKERLNKEFAKHKEILTDLLKKVPDQNKAVMESLLEKVNNFYNQLT